MINFHKGEVCYSDRFSNRSFFKKIKENAELSIDKEMEQERKSISSEQETFFYVGDKHYKRKVKDIYFNFFVDDARDNKRLKKYEYMFYVEYFATIVAKRTFLDILLRRKPLVKNFTNKIPLNFLNETSRYCDVGFLYHEYSLTAKAFLKDPKNALKAEKLKNLVKEKHQHYLNTGSVFSGDTDDYDNYIYVDFLHHDNVKCEAKYEYFQEFDLPNDNIVRPTKFVIEFKYECWFNKDTEKKYYQTFKDEINFY